MSPHDEYFDHLTAHSLPPAVRVAEAMAPVDAVIIDVGANLGLCTLPYALIARSGRVIAVEPGHRTAQDLRSSLEFNGLTNVEVMEVALGAEAGTATLIDPTWNASGAFVSAGSSSVATVHEASPEVEATTIQVTTLDQLVNDRSLRRLDLLKIDVEGFESAVLAGGVRTLERFHPLSVIEFNPFTLSVMASENPLHFLVKMQHLFPYVYGIDAWLNVERIGSESDAYSVVHRCFNSAQICDLICAWEPIPETLGRPAALFTQL